MWKLDATTDNVEATTATTIMALNIGYIPDFIQWKVEQGFTKWNKWLRCWWNKYALCILAR